MRRYHLEPNGKHDVTRYIYSSLSVYWLTSAQDVFRVAASQKKAGMKLQRLVSHCNKAAVQEVNTAGCFRCFVCPVNGTKVSLQECLCVCTEHLLAPLQRVFPSQVCLCSNGLKVVVVIDVNTEPAACFSAGNLLAELDTLKFFTKDLTTDFLFPTVHDAVLHCQHSNSHPSVAAVSGMTWEDVTWWRSHNLTVKLFSAEISGVFFTLGALKESRSLVKVPKQQEHRFNQNLQDVASSPISLQCWRCTLVML